MAFPSDTLSDTNLDVLIPEIWGSKINIAFENAIIAGKLFTDLSEYIADGGDVLYVPNFGNFGTADTKTIATAVTLEAKTETKVTLTVDTWVTKAFAIEDRELRQTKMAYNVIDNNMGKAVLSVANALESAIFALIPSFTNSVGSSTAAIADSNVRAAINYLVSANANQNEMFFIFHPSIVWTQLLEVEDTNGSRIYVNFDYNTSKPVAGEGLGDPMARGLRASGALYGIPVYTSTLLPYVNSTTGRYGILATKDAIVYGTLNYGGNQVNKVRVQSEYRVDYLSTLVVADLCYGVAINRNSDGGVKIITKA